MKLEMSNHRKIIIGLAGVGSAFLAVYLGTSLFFVKRFYPGSTINCISVSGKTVDEAYNEILDQTDNYRLDIKGRNGFNESIDGDDIKLIYNSDSKTVQDFKDSQNPFKWFSSAFNSSDYKNPNIISFDDNALNNKIENFECFDPKNVEEPRNPILQYEDGNYSILKETYGNKVDKEKLYTVIVNAIKNGDTVVDIEESGCYENPRFTFESKEIVEAKDTLDKYVSAKITYKIGGAEEVLDGEKIREFLDVDKDYQVEVDEKKVNEYVSTLAEKYNTIGKKRSFKATSGNVLSISGGDYGRENRHFK